MDANRPTETPTHATHPPQEPHESCDTYVTLVTRRDARQKIVTTLELPRTARAPPRHDLDGAPERHGLGPLRPAGQDQVLAHRARHLFDRHRHQYMISPRPVHIEVPFQQSLFAEPNPAQHRSAG